MTNATLLDRLAHLSAQRTARTDRLHEIVQVFLAALAPHMQVGDMVHLDKHQPHYLGLQRVASPRGPTWSFRATRMRVGGTLLPACDPTRPIGWTCPFEERRGVPLDAQGPDRGPRREDLILLADNASRFVATLVHERAEEEACLSSAIANGQKAIADAHAGLRA